MNFMKNTVYDFSSVHINIPEITDEVIKWGKEKIPDRDINIVDSIFGREDEIHVTILYGVHSTKSLQTYELLKKEKPVEIELGKVSLFDRELFDVVKIEVISDDLNRLNKKLRKHVKHTNKYKKYEPHITVAYVKKGKGWHCFNDQTFEGKKLTLNNFVFSSKKGIKKEFPFASV